MAAGVSKTEEGKAEVVRTGKPQRVDGRHKPRKRVVPKKAEEAVEPKPEKTEKPIVEEAVNEEEEQVEDDPDAMKKAARNARNALGRNCRDIMNMMADKAKEGNVACAYLLVKLSAEDEKYKKMKKGPSVPLALGNEPPWTGGKKNEEVALAAA
jgi:hypothetical protein